MRRKDKIAASQNGLCAYCGVAMTPMVGAARPPSTSLTLDHIIPQGLGGDNSDSNLVACCILCNARKRNHTPVTLRKLADAIERLMGERGLACDIERPEKSA